ncbi:MAG TPA: 4-hydroxy-tetrahydrodipicolinate synthase [Acidimicrobiales bacterium]|nr:4-hydroxy-tetrahydrodipicolinate synthase [Acidimicrobiales bacterium]
MARFGTVLTAMVTPFDDDLRLDLDAAATVARWLVDHGNDGLVVAGTTGEGPTLSDGEKLDLFRAVRDAVDVPVVAGTGTYDTGHSVHLTKEAVRIGVDGILAVTPYYNKPSQANLVHHCNAIAAAAGDTPVMLYDVPHRTSRRLDAATIIELAQTPNIVAMKDAAANPGESVRWRAETPEEFEMYSGDDVHTLPFLAVGAVGVVSVSAHWAGVQIGEMIAAFQKGDLDLARRLNEKLQPTYAFNSSDEAPSPAPSKAMLRTLGLPVGRPRPPMGPEEPADLEDRARKVYAQLG